MASVVRSRWWPAALIAAATLMGALAGGWIAGNRAIAARGNPPVEPGVVLDVWGRLIGYPNKQETDCPPQTPRTLALVVAGQSNAGNHGALRYHPRHAERVFNVSQGRCFKAASPLLGGSGRSGEYWGMLADALIDAGRADTVVLLPFAVGGSRVARWQPGGDLHAPFINAVSEFQRTYRVTQVLWHQGEADFLAGTSSPAYAESLRAVVASLRAAGVAAPFHVGVASRCLLVAWSPDTPVAEAQRQVLDESLGILAGADADAVWAPEHRFDDCHLSAAGQAAMAADWARRLR